MPNDMLEEQSFWDATKMEAPDVYDSYRTHGVNTALIKAIEIGLLGLIPYLVRLGAELSPRNWRDCYPLMFAAAIDNPLAINELLKIGAQVDAIDLEWNTALCVAAKYGCLSAMPALIDAGANMNFKGWCDCTPLHFAAANGHGSAVQILLERGASVTVTEDGGFTPLHCAAKGGHFSEEADPTRPKSACNEMSRENQGHIEAIQHLLAKSADVNAKDNNGHTPLHWASSYRRISTVNLLLDIDEVRDHVDTGRELVGEKNGVLRAVAADGDIVTLERLLAYREVVEKIAAMNNAALLAAYTNKHMGVVDRLIEFKAVREFELSSFCPQKLREIINRKVASPASAGGLIIPTAATARLGGDPSEVDDVQPVTAAFDRLRVEESGIGDSAGPNQEMDEGFSLRKRPSSP